MSIAPGRAALLQAALSHFAERGFEGASTRAIAERAGVPQGLVRHHFGSKDGLFREVVDEGLRALAASPADAAEPPTSDRALASALRGAPLLCVVTHALLEPGARRTWLVEQRLRPLLQRAGPALGGTLFERKTPLREQDVLALVGALLAPLLLAPVLAPTPASEAAHAAMLARLLGQSLAALRLPSHQPGAAGAWVALGARATRR